MRYLFLLALILMAACGPGGLDRPDSNRQTLQVLSVDPGEGSHVERLPAVTITFSNAIDPQSIHERTFLVIPQSGEENLIADPSKLASSIESGKVTGVKGHYQVINDGKTVRWIPDQDLEPALSYEVVLTSGVQTPEHFPLHVLEKGKLRPFLSRFVLASTNSSSSSDPSAPSKPSPGSNDEILVTPSRLMIHEVFYDPKETETDGYIFIELAVTPKSDLSGYRLRCVNGADGKKTHEILFPQGTKVPDDGFFVVADSKTGSSSETRVSNADLVANFDPQNGPDSIQLVSPSGEVVDVVGYGGEMSAKDAEGYPLFEGSPALKASAGESLTRFSLQDTNVNRDDFHINAHPSPGNAEDHLPSSSSDETLSPSEEEEDVSDDDEEIETENENPPPVSMMRVHFTEVVTDPQQDWNDSAGGNGIAFDSFPGSGTIGTSDEWIELKNGTNADVDLRHWKLEMNDGTDEVEEFASSSAFFVFSDGGNLENYHSDEFLVIGNAKGDLKNTIFLRLIDEKGGVVDELSVPDGNAHDVSDESYQMTGNAEWAMESASPFFLID